MNQLSNLGGLYGNVALIGAELILLIVGCMLIHVLFRLLLLKLERIPSLAAYRDRFKKIRLRLRSLIVFFCVLLCIAILGFNGVLIYQKSDPLEYTLAWIQRIPPGFWAALAIDTLAVIALVIVAFPCIRTIGQILAKLQEKAKAYKQITANNESIDIFFSSLNRIQKNSIWLLVFIWATTRLPFPALISESFTIFLKIYLIVSIGLLVVKAMTAIVDSLDALSKKYATTELWMGVYEKLRKLITLLRRCIEYIIYVIVATLVMRQVAFIAPFAEHGTGLASAIGIFFIARVVAEVAYLLVDRSFGKGEDISESEKQQQATILPIIKSLLSYLIYFAAFVLILQAVGLNPMPLLAGAGIAGVVIGLGAQPLINDMVSGFFILFENVFLVGDYIETNEAQGVVEEIALRTVRIRDPSGQLHILRNGQIGPVINFSKRYTFAMVEVGVDYDSNLDHVYRVLEETGEKLKEKNPNVLRKTTVLGLENFGESELLIRTVTKVKNGCHGLVAREFRKMIKEAFDAEGIEIPFARRVLVFKNNGDEASFEGNLKVKPAV